MVAEFANERKQNVVYRMNDTHKIFMEIMHLRNKPEEKPSFTEYS
jgi:hypothetical protein